MGCSPLPDLPRGVALGPEIVQIFEFAVGIHGEKEAFMAICRELAVLRELFEGLAFEGASRPAEVIEHLAVQDKMACRHPAIEERLFGKLCHLPLISQLQHAEPRN